MIFPEILYYSPFLRLNVLSKEQGKRLAELARKSVEAAFKGEAFSTTEFPQERGVFVTLHKGGALRGCIGYPLPVKALGQSVVETARAAAFEDPRFPPLSEGELGGVKFEVSVLTVPTPVEPAKVEVGRDGLLVEAGARSGLLLPQVPVEQGWSRKEFLEALCAKAGLPAGAWKNAELKAFQAQVFKEV